MPPDSPFEDFLTQRRQRLEQALQHYLPDAQLSPQRLHSAMRYAVLGAGKRIRPLLLYATGQAVGVNNALLDIPACAVELIHTYSLVHDDLPAMDDDALRRGRPTCHTQFDEATAILAGDALQTLAFRILTEIPQNDTFNSLLMVKELAQASGSRGMAGGQALDMAAIGQDLNLAELENMHIHKTGALIRASVRLGMLSAPAVDQPSGKQLDRYAECIGLAFQVQDDVLDVTGDPKRIGKTQGKDAANNKPTYPAIVGLKGANEMTQRLLQEALDSLQSFDQRADSLRQLAHYIVARDC